MKHMDSKAHGVVHGEILNGNLIRPASCTKCGAPAPDREVSDKRCLEGKRIVPGIQAHHADYTKPTEVEWLCTKCHGKTRIKQELKRIAFYVSEQEFKEIAKLAGDVPLSKWCRRKLMERIAVPVNEQAGQDRKKRLPRAETVSAVSGGFDTPVRAATSLVHCEHNYAANECPYVECPNFKRRM